MSLDEVMPSREPLELVDGQEVMLRFSGVEVTSLDTGQVLVLRGPVDLTRYGPVEMRYTNPRTTLPDTASGIRLLVSERDGEPVDMPWNVISKRVYTQLRGDLASGAYLQLVYGVTASGAAPKTRYQVRRMPPAG
jgi:hypothetical protein